MNDLARVARATNQAEAEFVQALLLEAGIPSMLRRSPGFDVPDMLAAGPRDVMVPSAVHDAAREVLIQAEIVNDDRAVVDPPTRPRLPARALRMLLEAMRIYPPAGGL
jgi:Putative prokaryotic signal transducing protein